MLFNAYCTPMYGCQLLNSTYEYNFKRLKIAFRVLSNAPRWTSASSLFASHGIPTLVLLFLSLFFLYALYVYSHNNNATLSCVVNLNNLVSLSFSAENA